MATNMGLADFRRNNLWVTFAVAAALLAFLFLPDMLGFEGGFHLEEATKNFSLHIPKPGKIKASNQRVKEVPQEAEEKRDRQQDAEQNRTVLVRQEVEGDSTLTPLELLSNQVEEGYIDEVVKAKRREAVAARKQQVAQKPKTWQQLKSSETRKLLGQAKQGAIKVAEKLGKKDKKSKYALMNFSNGIDLVLSRNIEKRMTVTEALNYLENLDIGVTNAFVREKVARNKIKSWSRVSLKPVLGRDRADQLKKEAVPVFRPEVRLIYVNIRQKKDRKRPGYISPAKPYKVKFGALIRGKGLKKAWVILENGKKKKLKVIPVKSGTGETGQFFRIDTNFIKGTYSVYTLLLKKKTGEEYRKSYSFHRAFSDYRWRPAGPRGKYYVPMIPLAPDPRSARLDTTFAFNRFAGGFQNFEDPSGQFIAF